MRQPTAPTRPDHEPVDHVYRHARGRLIERPDQARPHRGTPWRWTALVWPDEFAPDGWAALEWEPAERGWHLPATLVLGDVIEFGLCGLDPHSQPIAGTAQRWFGWIRDATDHALIITGPYPTPATAHHAARALVDEIRCDQLPAPTDPTVDTLDPERRPR